MKTADCSTQMIARCSLVVFATAALIVSGCGGGDAPDSGSQSEGAAGATSDAIRDAGDAAAKQLKEAADALADSVDQAAATAAAQAEAAKGAAAAKAAQAEAAAVDAVNEASDAVGKAATDAALAINQALPRPGGGSGMVVHTDPKTGAIIPSPAPGTEPVGGDVKMPAMPENGDD
jgi:hypothetical protein